MVVYFDWPSTRSAAFARRAPSARRRFRTAYPKEIAEMHFDFIIGDDPAKTLAGPRAAAIRTRRVCSRSAIPTWCS